MDYFLPVLCPGIRTPLSLRSVIQFSCRVAWESTGRVRTVQDVGDVPAKCHIAGKRAHSTLKYSLQAFIDLNCAPEWQKGRANKDVWDGKPYTRIPGVHEATLALSQVLQDINEADIAIVSYARMA